MTSYYPLWVRFILNRRTLYVLAWLLAAGVAVGRIWNGHLAFQDRLPENDPNRRVDGNDGHKTIDFGGSWMMGRMLMTGHGRELYSRPRLWEVGRNAYPPERASPAAPGTDYAELLSIFMGEDDPRWRNVGGSAAGLLGPGNSFQQAAFAIHLQTAWNADEVKQIGHPTKGIGVGGPLYPPIQAFVMAPFATGDHPQMAYFTMQYVQVFFCFVSGWGICRLSQGRIWCPLASTILLLYPGARGAIDLGQNSPMTLTMLIWGWVWMARGRPIRGGMIWGLLAYKPVWAISYFFLLLLLRRWRAALAMAGAGAGLALATLPFVGVHSWMNWLVVGQEATAIYNADRNWIPLSRDLLNIPRRMFTDFSLPRDERATLPLFVASWAAWAAVIEITLRVFHGRRPGPIPFVGPLPAFLVLTAWMTTYHFMYYDAMLSAFGVFVLLADPRPFFRPRALNQPELIDPLNEAKPQPRSLWLVNSFALTVVVLLVVWETALQPMRYEITIVDRGASTDRSSNRLSKKVNENSTYTVPQMTIGTGDEYPVDTFLIIALWGWCALTILAAKPPPSDPSHTT